MLACSRLPRSRQQETSQGHHGKHTLFTQRMSRTEMPGACAAMAATLSVWVTTRSSLLGVRRPALDLAAASTITSAAPEHSQAATQHTPGQRPICAENREQGCSALHTGSLLTRLENIQLHYSQFSAQCFPAQDKPNSRQAMLAGQSCQLRTRLPGAARAASQWQSWCRCVAA